jgi:hypothetical protein
MRRHHLEGSRPLQGKYIVEIDRTEKKGEIKKIPFRKREAALKLADRLLKRQAKVKVLSNGREIYPRLDD